MTWADLEQRLPNGFHDARLDEISINYRDRTAVFELEFWAVVDWPKNSPAEVPELYRRGRLTFSGLLACTMDVPNGEYQVPDACELWIDVAPADHTVLEHPSWPKESLPEGAFKRGFYFLNDSASFVHVAAQDIGFEWLSPVRLLYEAEAEPPSAS